MTFLCKICNYKTEDKSNLKRHFNSMRHQKNIASYQLSFGGLTQTNKKLTSFVNPQGDKSYTCTDCGFETAFSGSLSRHKRTCTAKEMNKMKLQFELKNLKEVSELKNEIATTQVDFLKNHVELLRSMLIASTRGIKGTVTSTALEHYSNNPPISEIEYMRLNSYIKPKSKLVDEMICAFEHNTIHEFLGAFILTIYKKKNYNEQSIFASDVSRLSYIVKETIYDDISEWVIDSTGLKVKQYVIKPLTDHVLNILKSYRIDLCNKATDLNTGSEYPDVSEVVELTKKQNSVLKLISYIEDNKLDNRINKFICPSFKMDTGTIHKLNSKKKNLPALGFDFSKK
uniref:C2H2-type domain-containing protein n=1 Tax=viral metagenome TaxID=1070528 RepID=A0A6C0ACF0_9ZZZZ